ncbi:ATP-binding protein [Massilia jejuensis]|uniref:ATP-binding protein n=1 Tax=Massilia jejuensis TaxID=648894 RepID=A0ABW0PKN9_9BURK
MDQDSVHTPLDAGSLTWWRSVAADLAVVTVVTVAVFLFAIQVELSERLSQWELRHESWQVDELPVTLMVLLSGLMWFSWRRARQAQREIRERVAAQKQVEALLAGNRDLARQLLMVQENERRALARELHDEFGQNCTAIRADATYILHARAGDNAGITASAQRIGATSEALYKLVKTMLRRLRPMTLDSLGLVPALQELCEHWEEQTGVSCGFCPFAVPEDLDDLTCITLFRLVQEGLTNVARHAQATHVTVELRRGHCGEQLRLSIEDDGCGMAVEGVTPAGFGLIGMRERVANLQGRLRIGSAPGQGVRIEAMLPIPGARA